MSHLLRLLYLRLLQINLAKFLVCSFMKLSLVMWSKPRCIRTKHFKNAFLAKWIALPIIFLGKPKKMETIEWNSLVLSFIRRIAIQVHALLASVLDFIFHITEKIVEVCARYSDKSVVINITQCSRIFKI